jgi:hypothetical protein
MMLEIFQCLRSLLYPLELVLPLQELEERKSSFRKSGDESVKGCHAPCELLDIFNHLWGPHVGDCGDLLRVGFNSLVGDDEPE